MEKQEREDQPRGPQENRGAPVPPAPRGNPETDRESVDKGEEQLRKISGH